MSTPQMTALVAELLALHGQQLADTPAPVRADAGHHTVLVTIDGSVFQVQVSPILVSKE